MPARSGYTSREKDFPQVMAHNRTKGSHAGHGRTIDTERSNGEFGPETADDDAALQTVEPDQFDVTDVQSSDTTALCRRLSERVRSGESQETLAISEELVRRGNDCVAEVSVLLHSGNPSVETGAMRILVRIGTTESVAAAIAKMLAEPSGDSRNNLLKVFGNIRNADASGVIIGMLASEKRQEGLANLKGILSAMEGPEVVDALASRIAEEKDQAVLAKYLDVLADMSKPSNTAALEDVLASDRREAVQVAVASALARIGDNKSCAILARNGVTNVYCEKALEDVRSPYAQQTLMDIAAGPMDGNVRIAAIKALVNFNTPEVKACLHRIEEKEQDGRILDAVRLALSGIDSGMPDMQSKTSDP